MSAAAGIVTAGAAPIAVQPSASEARTSSATRTKTSEAAQVLSLLNAHFPRDISKIILKYTPPDWAEKICQLLEDTPFFRKRFPQGRAELLDAPVTPDQPFTTQARINLMDLATPIAWDLSNRCFCVTQYSFSPRVREVVGRSLVIQPQNDPDSYGLWLSRKEETPRVIAIYGHPDSMILASEQKILEFFEHHMWTTEVLSLPRSPEEQAQVKTIDWSALIRAS